MDAGGIPVNPHLLRTGVVVAVTAACVVAVSSGCSVIGGDLRVGDCFDAGPVLDGGTGVRTSSCSGQHDAEVVGIVPVPGDTREQAVLDEIVAEECEEAFEEYVGAAAWDSMFRLRALVPSEEAWQNESDRVVICFAWTAELGPIDYSVRDVRA